MSRHRNIRKLDYSEEYEYDEVYGRSLEEEVAVSPNTAAEFLYQRDGRDQPSLNSYMQQREDAQLTPRTEDKVSAKTSPLATTCCTAVTSALDIGPPPGFLPKSRIDNEPLSQGSARRISSSSVPKVGFNPSLTALGEHLSGTPSPSRSPCRSPARSPSPTSSAVKTLTASKLGSSATKSRQHKIDVLAELRQREESSKEKINLVVIGHVDAGKSTLMGHLLYLIGAVSKKLMHKYEQESQKIGKGSFAYAWVLDETGEERNRGITMDVAQQMFETESKAINLLDAPGHRDFIPNMITGAAQADVAVLVVNATVGEFEAGFEAGGQTREHAMLVRSLGVRQLAVAVNKMDTVNWSETRFKEIVQKLKLFLKQAGYKEADVSYIPCSGLSGDNLVKPSSVPEFHKWYSGPTLLATLDQFTAPSRPIHKPFRSCIGDIFKSHGTGVCVAGKVDSGTVQAGDNVYVLPAQEVASIKCKFDPPNSSDAMSVNEEPVSWVAAGDQVIFNISGVDISKINVGGVLCSMQQPVKVATTFEARIIVFNIDIPITTGYPVTMNKIAALKGLDYPRVLRIVLHYLMMSEPAVVTKLVSLLNKTTGELVKKRPRCIAKNSTAVIRIRVLRPICLELYSDSKELGRFMLRSSGHTVAAGVITKIL